MKVRVTWKFDEFEIADALKVISESEEPEAGDIHHFIWQIAKQLYASGYEKPQPLWLRVSPLIRESKGSYTGTLRNIYSFQNIVLGLPSEVDIPNDVIDGYSDISLNRIAIQNWLSDKYGRACNWVYL